MANWKKVLVSGSAIEVLNITASNLPESTDGSAKLVVYDTSTGNLAYTGSSAGGGGGIFVDRGDYQDTDNSLKITGSTLQAGPAGNLTETKASSYTNNNYAFIVSQSAYFSNHNVGHPNSLAWQSGLDGTIFSDYNATTDVAEILRTVVGLLSASSAGNLVDVSSPSAEPVKFKDYRVQSEQGPTTVNTSLDNVILPQGYTEENATYFEHKGFGAGEGNAVLSNVGTVYQNTGDNWGQEVDLRNTNNSYNGGFDGGSNSTPIVFFGKVTQSFGDAQIYSTNLGPGSSTFTTQSSFRYVINKGETLNGITVQEIATGNPSVIPPQFKKVTAHQNIPLQTDRKNGDGADAIAFTDISSSGYYKYQGALAGIATSSLSATEEDTIFYNDGLQSPTSEDTGIYFFTPITDASITNTAATYVVTVASSSFTSRSLSGAPYLNSGQYEVFVTASNVFKPLYGGNRTVGEGAFGGSDLTFTSDVNQSAVINVANRISAANRVYNGDTDRGINQIPGVDDTIRFREQSHFDKDGSGNTNDSNIREASITDQDFTYTVTTRNFKSSSPEETDITTIKYHIAGAFGQPTASGSLAYFISNDGDDPSTATEETFKGEKYRRVIDDPETLTTAWDSGSRLSLGSIGDLQVKPGYLVNPESSDNGYWYISDATSNYKYYLREFDLGTTGGNRTNLQVDIIGGSGHSIGSSDIVPYTSTTDNRIAVALIFEAQLPANSGETNVKLWDVDQLNTNYINNGVSAATAQFNPFSSAIDFRGNFADGSAQSTQGNGQRYALKLNNGIFQRINNSFGKVWVLVRYKGNPDSISNIELTATT